MAVDKSQMEVLEAQVSQAQQDHFRRVREAKKFQARMKAREGFKNHVRGIEKLMELKKVVPTKYLVKKEEKN